MPNAEKMSRMKQVKPKYKEEKHSFGKGKMSNTFEVQKANAKHTRQVLDGYSKNSTLD